MGNQFDALALASLPLFEPDAIGIRIIQVQATTAFFRNAGRESDFYPESLEAGRGVISTLPDQVRGMGDHATRHIGKPLPLFKKIIPAVIADAVEKSSVGVTEFRDVRSIKNDLAAIRDGGLQFVHTLGAGPDVVVHFAARRTGRGERDGPPT